MENEPLYSSLRDEDRAVRAPFRMTEPESINATIKQAPKGSTVASPTKPGDVKPARLLVDKKRLAKTFDRETSKTIVANLKDGTPLPPLVAKKLVDKKIVVAKDTEAADKNSSGAPRKLVLKKEDIFDKITNVVMKTFNIK